jgi:hypothetical protein
MMLDLRTNLSSYMTHLLSRGQIVFTDEQAQHALQISKGALLDATQKQQRRNYLITPRHGFYVIVPPPSWYIDALMAQEQRPYYVGLLKAAELHGATHQVVMEFQVIALFGQYLQAQDLRISRAQAEERMFANLASPGFLSDVRPLLAAEQAERLTDRTMKTAFADVLTRLVGDLPGDRWARTEEMLERFGIDVSR